MHSYSYWITIVIFLFDSIENCWKYQGNSSYFLIKFNVRTIRLSKYFWCTHLHTSSLSFIDLLIQSNIVSNSKVISVVVFSLNAIFVRFNSLYIFESLTFILHHSLSSFFQFNEKTISNSKVRWFFLSIKFSYDLTHYIFLIRWPSYFITLIRCFIY